VNRFWRWFFGEEEKEETHQLGRVTADKTRCVQCGVCGFNCPVGIPVRDYARRGLPVDDPGCITCGQCIEVCPRGTLRWETEGVIDRYLQREEEQR
jgi:heterodisulfide reductase subunit C